MSNPRPNLSSFDPLASQQQQQPQSQQSVPHATATTSPPTMDNPGLVSFLTQQGLFSSGLLETFLKQKHKYPLRIWVVDNSAAMQVHDSHRISPNFESIPATRWDELKECIAFHAQLSIRVPHSTRFALLNPPSNPSLPQYISVGQPQGNHQKEWETLRNVMTHSQPHGPTCLAAEIAKLRAYIQGVAPQLRQQQQTVTIVLATQGLPSEGGAHLIQALRSLEGLPICMVLRLCTDDENVFEFYNSLDSKLDTIKCDVLDDFFGEALEVFLRNPWLTYGLALHRFREVGFYLQELDALDERPLHLPQLRQLCQLLFANAVLPDPTENWNAFLQAVGHYQAKEPLQWNPVTRRMSPWINLHHLHQLYGSRRFSGAFPQPHPGFPPSPRRPQESTPEPSAGFFTTNTASSSNYVQPPAPAAAFSQPQHPTSTQPQQRTGSGNFQQSGFQQQQPQPGVPPSQHRPPPGPSTQQQPSSQQPTGDTMSDLKRNIMLQWALQPPTNTFLRPISYLLGTVQNIFPPALGVEPHDYFQKWKPFSLDALSSEEAPVLKRAIKKMKFFLHPDKLPNDLTEKQSLLCKTIWDVIADAVEIAERGT